MNEIATTTEDRPMHQDDELASLHRLLGQLRREEQALRASLEELDEQDAHHYDAPADDPDAMQRQRTRLATDAALKQVLNRIRGATDALAKRERELVAAHVEKIRSEIHTDLDAMDADAREANKALNLALRAIQRMQERGRNLVQKYRGVRGRSTLTDQGHIAGGEITAMADPGNIKFALESHLATYLPGLHTEHGATGEFAVRICGQIGSMRMSIDALLGQEAFEQAVAAEALAAETGKRRA